MWRTARRQALSKGRERRHAFDRQRQRNNGISIHRGFVTRPRNRKQAVKITIGAKESAGGGSDGA